MALQFQPPPDWLIKDYLDRRNQNPGVEAINGANQIMQNYAQQKALEQKQALLKQQNDLLVNKEEREGRQQFYDYGDVAGLPKDVQASIGQPAQGPSNVIPAPAYDVQRQKALGNAQGPVQPQADQVVPAKLPSLIERYNKFLTDNPQGMKGTERTRNLALQQSEIEKNTAQADLYRRSKGTGNANPAKPQLRLNEFTGEYEWYQPPDSGTVPPTPSTSTTPSPGSSPVGTPRPAHGPGTFRDVSKAAAAYAEDKSLVDGALGEINRVKVLNKNSRGGVGGSLLQRGQSALNMGTESPEFKNTADVINTMKGAVSRVLKSTFGGQLSDSERAYLNEVYGAVEKMTPAERDIAMTNVSTMLENKVKTSKSKLDTLSGNSAPTSQPQSAQPTQTPQQSQAPTVSSQEQYDALPSGTEYLGPDGSLHRKK